MHSIKSWFRNIRSGAFFALALVLLTVGAVLIMESILTPNARDLYVRTQDSMDLSGVLTGLFGGISVLGAVLSAMRGASILNR